MEQAAPLTLLSAYFLLIAWLLYDLASTKGRNRRIEARQKKISPRLAATG